MNTQTSPFSTVTETIKSYEDIRDFILEHRGELIKFIKDTEFKQINDYQAINMGHCYFFVRLALHLNPNLKIAHNHAHCMILHGDKLIDATGMYDLQVLSQSTIRPVNSDFSKYQFEQVAPHAFTEYWETHGKYAKTFQAFNQALLSNDITAVAQTLRYYMRKDLEREQQLHTELSKYFNTSNHNSSTNDEQYNPQSYHNDHPEAHKKSYKFRKGVHSAWEL